MIDERLLTARSGDGGDGAVAWRREKYVPRGGPAGGDGGRGGDVVFVADSNLTTFDDMEQDRILRAGPGGRGKGALKSGANGDDLTFLVPPGTTVYDARSGERIADLVRSGDRLVVAKGGRGGRGNARFATATDQRPANAEPGEKGVERRLRLELRLLADVGIVGLPNAGKSTFLAAVSAATPRVAAYPFTTLEPGLGTVEREDGRRFVVADLPGLVEGAHRGRGLGDRFLRHVERTRVLLHLVDLFPPDGGDPVEAWRSVRAELEAYGRGLADRPEIVAATKGDLAPSEQERVRALSRFGKAVDRRVHLLSARTGDGVADLLRAVEAALEKAPKAPDVPDRVPAENGDEVEGPR
jgi:GTP-binding protein